MSNKTPKRKIQAVDDAPPNDDTKRRKVDSGSDVSDSDISDSDLTFLNKPPAIFNGINISCTGKLSRTRDEIARLVVEYGGTFAKGPSKKVNYMVASADAASEASMTFKLSKELKIPIVTESFLDECIKSAKLLPHEQFLVGKIGATAKPEQSSPAPSPQPKQQEPTLDPSEEQLIKSLRTLFSVDTAPVYHDLEITVDEKTIYCIAGLLSVRSPHFENLINEAKQKQKSNVIKLEVDDASAVALIATVQYLMTANITLESIADAISVIEYAIAIDCQKCAVAARSFIEAEVNQYVKQNDMGAAFAVFNQLQGLTIDLSDVAETLQQLMKKSPATLFQEGHFIKLSRSMLADFLKDDELPVDEIELFNKLIVWGATNLLAEDKPKEDLKPTDTVYVETDGDFVTNTFQNVTSTDKWVPAKDLREYLLPDLLPLIRYEHIPTGDIFKKLEPKKLFSNDEVLEMFKAAAVVSSGDTYTILGVDYQKRTKREPKLSDVFDFYVSQVDLDKGRVTLPNVSFCGLTWYVVVMKTMHDAAPHLSFYLYNKVIAEGGKLTNPITTSITFRVLNKNDASKNKRQKFTKTWKDVKAWGYSNVLKITELFDTTQGWLETNGTFRLQVQITKSPQ